MKVYISGPMTGLPALNRPAFAAAFDALTALGHDVIDPGAGETPDLTWEEYLRADLLAMLTCDGLALLPGWEKSRGASLEVHVATQLGMDVRSLEDWLVEAPLVEVLA